MRKPKYSYDIRKIEEMENQRISIREIARRMNWSEQGTHTWIKRNFKRVVKYIPNGDDK